VAVLVVEDDEMVLILAGDILREFGYRGGAWERPCACSEATIDRR
jgi:hypothetical protein